MKELNENKTNRKILGLIAAVAILVVIAILFLILKGTHKNPEAKEVGENFVQLLTEGRTDEAYILTTDEFKKIVPVGDLQAFSSAHTVLSENTYLAIDKVMPESEQTVLVGTIKDSGDATAPVIMYMKQDQKFGWQVSFFSINPSDIPVELNFVKPEGTSDQLTIDTASSGEVGE
ncbi:hypothetical protein COY25_01210 [Candidatus Uhrbacteria bacterium CG_4_10_14_0_2_um_filter_41_7]|uniref:DUF4878 domain-containing protein n=1 Tax=Candidatus Uhrbacteria bacterium CG_4_9_14_3_um_filter_41_35 TaxID=1975034 RepID=A0A2M7XFL4_9BACT|nr:MAG: hypothetical protein COV92_01430 [Candidatus Uhrbacteria bacterium CG11_big_fil_rev_8_21_14_0_20_41_9]PIZ55205.1 MAG: hypothetical protein COY25_01210 [Candidatus Uhrbacteria bacterium CG_4_10_14_0_2_um_filter_41_7]PJA46663.1 MAG: hypothetical protein CO173_02750 [Candidatus Uhrbacteria bacterium CG_4_9_14_3_um_filter_41_35]